MQRPGPAFTHVPTGAPRPSWRAHFMRLGVTDARVLAAANAVDRAVFLEPGHASWRPALTLKPQRAQVGRATVDDSVSRRHRR